MTDLPPLLPVERGARADPRDGDLSDLLSELRILLPGAQMLTAFLIILPFHGGARDILLAHQPTFLATLLCALGSLLLLSAPAIQHRLMRPLVRRELFKRMATREIVAGSAALGCAFVFGTNLVICSVLGDLTGHIASAAMALCVIGLWWLLPLYLKRRRGY